MSAGNQGRKPARVPPTTAAGKSLIRAADVKPEILKWLWLDRIPCGTVTLIGGRPGQGKSLFTNFLAAEVTKAGGAVIMSNPEDALATVKVPRLMAAEADTRLVHFWPGKLRLPTDVDDLEQMVRFHGVALVTIDPIAKHVVGRDPNTALEPLASMAEKTGCAVVGVHHLNKRLARDAHPQEAFGGASGGWLGTVRFAHVLGPTADGETETRFLGIAKSNHADDSKASCEFYVEAVDVDANTGLDETLTTARLVFVSDDADVDSDAIVHYRGGRMGREKSPEKRRVATEFLMLLLMYGPKPALEVEAEAKAHGISQKTLQRAADGLGVIHQRVGWGPGSHVEWSLPPDNPIFGMIGAGEEAPPLDAEELDVDALIDQILQAQDLDEDDEGDG